MTYIYEKTRAPLMQKQTYCIIIIFIILIIFVVVDIFIIIVTVVVL